MHMIGGIQDASRDEALPVTPDAPSASLPFHLGAAGEPTISKPGATGAFDDDNSPPLFLDGTRLDVQVPTADTPVDSGEFNDGLHTRASQTRCYKIFLPSNPSGALLPLVVMLHGCGQGPSDFAMATGMNERAQKMGFIVLYPAQSQRASLARCWNWFKRTHQQRGRGEPALLASMTQMVVKKYAVDPRRIYIAGLSAGGAMAMVMVNTYPELFAAAGVHSGLPFGAADNLADAMAVMKNGVQGRNFSARVTRATTAAAALPGSLRQVPTIVFHGDQDRTVHPRNGSEVIAGVLGSAATLEAHMDLPSCPMQSEQGVSAKGRHYTRSTYCNEEGKAVAEHWLVHGIGHAWSGGHEGESFTDASGPNATDAMLRFFLNPSNCERAGEREIIRR